MRPPEPSRLSEPSNRLRRLMHRARHDDSGTGVVAALTLMFVFTAGALIWLSRDVDRADQAQTDATSIAFQAARAGAQQVEPDSLFGGLTTRVDPERARVAVNSTVATLLAKFDERGTVTAVAVDGDRVTVTLEIVVAGRRVVGTGSARARHGVAAPGD